MSIKYILVILKKAKITGNILQKQWQRQIMRTCLCNNITFTEHAPIKAWDTIGRLSIIWKSDLFDKRKGYFYQFVSVFVLLYRCTIWMPTKALIKRENQQHNNTTCSLEKNSSSWTPQKSWSTVTATYFRFYKPFK